MGNQDPALVGDMRALRTSVDPTSDALAAVPHNRLGRLAWFTAGGFVPLVRDTRLLEGTMCVPPRP